MTGKQEDPGFDPETVFNEGRELGYNDAESALREQIEEMADSGMMPDEIEQALFSGDTDIYKPGRRGKGGKRKCSAKQWAKMPQICRGQGRAKVKTARHPVMVYDPVSRGGYRAAAKRYYKKKGGAKGLIAGLRPLILPASAFATVVSDYQTRADALKTAGALNKDGTPVDGLYQAVMYDVRNWKSDDAMARVKARAGEIVTPALLGIGLKYGAKKVKLHPKVNQIAGMSGDAFIGRAIGKLVKTILDPPITPASARQPAIQVVQPERTQPAPTFMSGNPTGGF